ncbi:hypothetical protein ACS0TW_09175, partial [Klebsiella michiganensis]
PLKSGEEVIYKCLPCPAYHLWFFFNGKPERLLKPVLLFILSFTDTLLVPRSFINRGGNSISLSSRFREILWASMTSGRAEVGAG